MGTWEGRKGAKTGSLAISPSAPWRLASESSRDDHSSGGLADTDASCPHPFQVRLLTGIGRYNEMTYIFDLLHKKHYFEVLMRKKLDPVGVHYFELQDGIYCGAEGGN